MSCKPLLNVKLPYLEIENDKRSIARRYLSEIKNDKIILPLWDLSDNHVFHLFVIRTNNRQELQDYLLKNGVQTAIHYPATQTKALQHELSFPITENA
jgi:dTDP-4-amino-4,6-dideoxygalactose transaminase